MNVAIVDDERKIRDGVYNLFDWESLGMKISGRYEDGEVALEAFKKDAPDIVITDIKMPFIDGIELIEECKKAGLKCRFIIISGYDEFSLAQKALRLGAVDYLLKPVKKDELEELLMKTAGKLQLKKSEASRDAANIYNVLVFNNEFDKQINAILHNYGIDKIKQFLVAVANREIEVPASNIVAAKIKKSGHTVMIITGENSADCYLKSRKIIEKTSAEVFTGLSTTTSKALKLNEHYLQALEVCSNKEKFHGKKWSDYNQLRRFPYADFSETEKIGLKLFNALRHYNKAEADTALLEMRILFEEKIVDADSIDFFITGLYKEGLELLEYSGIKPDNESSAILKSFKELKKADFSDIPMKIENYINFLYQLTVHNTTSSRPEIKRALQYIIDNYRDQNLDITSTAEAAGISAGYFSTLFKNETGISFSDYLCNYRLGVSKKILKTKALRNYEIAELTGFRNSAYFCSVFKKITGLTPGEYRERSKTDIKT